MEDGGTGELMKLSGAFHSHRGIRLDPLFHGKKHLEMDDLGIPISGKTHLQESNPSQPKLILSDLPRDMLIIVEEQVLKCSSFRTRSTATNIQPLLSMIHETRRVHTRQIPQSQIWFMYTSCIKIEWVSCRRC